jgi:hypothetical protein
MANVNESPWDLSLDYFDLLQKQTKAKRAPSKV